MSEEYDNITHHLRYFFENRETNLSRIEQATLMVLSGLVSNSDLKLPQTHMASLAFSYVEEAFKLISVNHKKLIDRQNEIVSEARKKK